MPAFFVRYNRRPFAERREKGECMANAAGMTSKQWLPLIGLAFSAFMLNTSEFMPIGLLVDIAADFSMTEAEAGAGLCAGGAGFVVTAHDCGIAFRLQRTHACGHCRVRRGTAFFGIGA